MASGVSHADIHAADGDWPVKAQQACRSSPATRVRICSGGWCVSDFVEGRRSRRRSWLHSACGDIRILPYWMGDPLSSSNEHRILGGRRICGGCAGSGIVNAASPGGIELVDAAPILCAGVTTYKALKGTEAKPGEWVVISGIGGLGHVAVQYALAMGLHVAAVDIAPDKLELARSLGAEIVINAAVADPAAAIQKLIGGAHRVVVTAAAPGRPSSKHRPTAGRVLDANLRSCAEAAYDPRFDRRYARGSAGSASSSHRMGRSRQRSRRNRLRTSTMSLHGSRGVRSTVASCSNIA